MIFFHSCVIWVKINFRQMSVSLYFSAICPFGDLSFRSDVFRLYVYSVICLSVICPFGQMSHGHMSFRSKVFRSYVRFAIYLSTNCLQTSYSGGHIVQQSPKLAKPLRAQDILSNLENDVSNPLKACLFYSANYPLCR